jgi:hypothetical protein
MMAKLSREELEEIVERDLPGYTLAPEEEGADQRATEAKPDVAAPEIGELREKYLGDNNEIDADATRGDADDARAETNGPDADSDEGGVDDADEPSAENTDDEIVTVRPKGPADPFDHAARPKTIVVSGKDRRIIGSQG